MPYIFANLARTVLTAPLSVGGLTATVASTADFPATEFSMLRIRPANSRESVLRVSDVEFVSAGWPTKTATAFPITRAREGSTAKEWPIGSIVELLATAAPLNYLHDYVSSVASKIASGTGAPNHDGLKILGGHSVTGDFGLAMHLATAKAERSVAIGE